MEQVELIFVPVPGFGHIISAVEVAKLIVKRDERLSITIIILKLPMDADVTAKSRQSLLTDDTQRIRFVDLPQHHDDDDEVAALKSKSKSPVNFIATLIERQRSQVRKVVAHIKATRSPRLCGFVVDMFCTSMIDVANHFGLPTYVFFTSGAAFLGMLFYLLSLADDHNQDVTQLRGSDAVLSVPSFVNPVPVKVFPLVTIEKEGGGSAMMLALTRRLKETKGIMINTFLELESHTIKSLAAADGIPPIYPVGPILHVPTHSGAKSLEEAAIMKWLDDQPPSSVVYLCFGSMGTFDEEQVKEIARALERTGYRFLWSLRRQPAQLSVPTEYENPGEVLPEGFLERTAGIGKLIGWAPQVSVLSHRAVGAFVSHCGWNSITESLWCGVPIATWPMYSEQQMNAFQLVVELKLAAEIKLEYSKDPLAGAYDENNNHTDVIVTAQEIEKGIRGVMEGESDIRKNAKEMTEKGRRGMMEGGSSYTCLGRFIQQAIDNIPQPS